MKIIDMRNADLRQNTWLSEELVNEIGLPFKVSEIKYANDQLFDVAKGCLLAAKLGGI
jgi:hypothetical protein